jgi:peptide/nickel transport system substrate-binding protein
MHDYCRNVYRLLLLLPLLLLAACEIEGGVPPPATPGAVVQPTVATSPEPTSAPRDMGFRVGLLDAPADLLPYHADAGDRRITAPVSELLFPEPLLPLNYTYTTTGVLERMPTFENGDVELRSVDVYLDAAGTITTTETETITQVEQLVVTYHWNPDLRWSDGTPVTAADSLFAYELAQTVSLGEEANNRLVLLERYEQVDEHTTRAFLKPDFMHPFYFLTFWTPLPSHLLAELPAEELMQSEFALRPVGYGPYIVERRDQDGVRLQRNPYYFGAPPPAEVISFAFLPGVDTLRSSVLSGSLDVAVADRIAPEQLEFLERDEERDLLGVAYTPGPIWEHLDFNLDTPLLQDIRVRRAIAQGLDRQALVDTLFDGHVPVLDSWILPEQAAAAPTDRLTRYPHDPEEAQRLLDEVGWADSDGDGIRERAGEPVVIELLTTDGAPLRDQVAERFTADMAALGIQVNVRALPVQELYSRDGPLFRREFQVAQFAWIASPDPGGLALWSCTAVPTENNGWTGNNFAGWCFREADRAIRTANTSLDQAERREAYVRQQELFTQEIPVVPLFQRLVVTISNPNLAGLEPDPIAPITWNIGEWQRE